MTGGSLAGFVAAVGPEGWRALLALDAVVSWVAAVLLLLRPVTTPLWRAVASGWAPALPAAYAVGLLLR